MLYMILLHTKQKFIPSHDSSPYTNRIATKNDVEKKEEIGLSPMTKAPTPTEKYKQQRDNPKCQQKLRLHNDYGST